MTPTVNMCNFLIAALGIYSVFIRPSQGSVKYIYQNSTVPTDASVQSDNYPGVYPLNLNVTWVFETTKGLWGVYFRDFDLSRHEDFTDGGDRLRIQSERSVGVMTYTYTSQTESYISKGPRLTISFITDNKVDDENIRGFDLQIVYGQTESEVRLKLHEATRRRARSEENDGPSATLIASIVITALVIATLGIIGVLKLRASMKVKGQGDRDVFGVRRGSGVRHSRRGSSASPPQTPDGPDGQRPHAIARQGSVQNGRLGWMARAERNNSLSSTRRNQSFESSDHPTCATSATHSHHTNPYSNHTGTGGTPESHRHTTHHHHQPIASTDAGEAHNMAHSKKTKEIERVFECVSDRVGKCRDTSHSFRFACPKGTEALGEINRGSEKVTTRARTPGLNEHGSEETSRKMSFESDNDDLDDNVSSSSPPPYESLLESFVPTSACTNMVCYGNVLDTQPVPCGVLTDNTSSDVDINASDPEQEEVMPIMERGIDYETNHSIDSSVAADSQANSKLSIPKCVVSDHSSSPATSHRQLPAHNSEEPTSSEHYIEAGQLCFVDGYAYIVPQPDERGSGGSLRSTTLTPPSRHKTAQCRLSAVPDAVRASQLANELGYIDMFTHAAPPRGDNVYTNEVLKAPAERVNIAV